ncbi:MAG: DUF881 domain-containing protein [Gudongella sp.]|jgi:uncharacterized protein YlxW (UPF0749 family)|nr:DUF881 domain-containing protein [Gudongella sp.]
MKSINPKVTIGLFSLIIGVLIASQMKLKVDLITPVTIQSIVAQKNELSSLRNQIDELEKNIEQKERELELLESIDRGEANIYDIIREDLSKNKASSGYTGLKGPGVKIVMFDNIDLEELSFGFNDDIIHDVDIMNIINDLKVAGAEAISINDERVMSYSEIKCGGPIIRINGKSIGTPFIIRAIGDPQLLMAAVNAPGTYGETLRTVFGIGLQPYAEDEVSIPAYSGDFAFSYAEPLEEGE